jgi:penicillin V acylase-like amidase (Ntn superfamily)
MINRRDLFKSTGIALLGSSLALGSISIAEACTRVLWNTNNRAVIVGRTMDWPESTEPVLTVFPAGVARDGGLAGGAVVVAENPARWSAKYGSLVTTIYGIGSADGLNERGLAGHMLYLNETDFGPRDTAKPALHAGLWLQYALDNAASVTEALTLLSAVQVVMVEANGHKANVHLALEDASGDSAIIEYIGGKPVIHHGREFRVMTNDPSYDQQLVLLKQIEATSDFAHPSSNTPLPGNVSPPDRFQRASYYAAVLPEPANEREAIASMFAIMANVSVPFGAPYKGFGVYNTEYRTVTDLTTRSYYFQLTTSPSVIWVDLTTFNLEPGAPVLELNPDDIALAGDVRTKFQPAKAPF